ncbi:CPBP family intramembrane glutamic endopeptidase [Membranihabitans marinus]|uniref:CPBP family intramembrane glutamic endopeptidase n=1 Tax=Membranihabitans marinus TaxID=1227546 RepID=UPI001F2E3C78|nr:type II CAAX endopeptidase family protein [Membranihabitans marinus]
MFLLNAKYNGVNGWSKFVLTFGLCIGLYILSSLPMIIYSQWAMLSTDEIGVYTSPFGFALTLFVFSGFIAGIVLGTRYVHERQILSVFTGNDIFRWKRFLQGLSIWFVILLGTELIGYLVDPSTYVFQFDLQPFLGLLLVSVLVLPIQTTAEELFFRGYLMQQIALIFQYRWVPILITSILFGAMHLSNPEVAQYGLFKSMSLYIGLGLFFAIIAVMDNGLELPIGIHFINNFYSFVLVGYENSVFEGVPSVFLKSYEELTLGAVISNLMIMVIALFLMQKYLKWPSFSLLFERIKS